MGTKGFALEFLEIWRQNQMSIHPNQNALYAWTSQAMSPKIHIPPWHYKYPSCTGDYKGMCQMMAMEAGLSHMLGSARTGKNETWFQCFICIGTEFLLVSLFYSFNYICMLPYRDGHLTKT